MMVLIPKRLYLNLKGTVSGDPTNLKLSDPFLHNASGIVPSKLFPDKSLKKKELSHNICT